MSTGALLPFAQAGMPAHLANAFDTNIQERDTTPQLTFRGKVWRINLEGEEHAMMKGDDPIPSMRVVILDYNKNRSRAYYEGDYVEGESKSPSCWSSDGTTPDASVPNKCAATCGECPNAVKGSKVTANNKPTTACSTFKNIAVVPYNDLKFKPLRLRIPQTSMWDKENAENEAKGFFAFDQFIDFIRSRGATSTAAIVTKIKFDTDKAYPKILFSPEGYITSEEVADVKALLTDPSIPQLLGMSVGQGQAAPAAKVPAPAAAKTPVPALDAEEEDDDPVLPTIGKAAAKVEAPAEPEPAKPAAPKRAKAAPTTVDNDTQDVVQEAAATQAPPPVANGSIASLLDGWDD